jgi:hypothetical protein
MTEQKKHRGPKCTRCGRPAAWPPADVESGPHPSDCDRDEILCDDCEEIEWTACNEWLDEWWARADAHIVTQKEAMTVIYETGDCEPWGGQTLNAKRAAAKRNAK